MPATTETAPRQAASRFLNRTTATHTLTIPRGARLGEPGGRGIVWEQARAQTVEARQREDGRFVVVLDNRTYYVDESEVRDVCPID